MVICMFKCVRALCCCFKKRKCEQPPNYKDNIRVYSLQYTAVPTDEKQAEKEKPTVEQV